MKTIVRIALCWLGGVLLLPAQGQSVADWLPAGLGMRHAAIPIYSDPDQKLSMVVRVDQTYTEYEKRGFFRIGALPVAVLEGVTFEIKDPAPAAKSLARLRGLLGAEAGNHVELRQVKFVVSPGSSLEGGRVLFLGDDRWELVNGVRLVSGTNEMRAEKATLQVAGEQAGQVILQTTPPTTNTFLFCNLTPNLNTTPK
jgi:hypothetical protein